MGQFTNEEGYGVWAYGELEMLMNELVEIFKAVHPDGPPMLVYRGGMWAGSMYQKQWQVLQNQSLFLKDKRLCTGCIEYPLNVDVSGFESHQTHTR